MIVGAFLRKTGMMLPRMETFTKTMKYQDYVTLSYKTAAA